MKTKILITGANGLLGQSLSDLILLQSEKYEFLATGTGKNRHPKISNQNYQELDILDQRALIQVISNFKPDFIINTVAMTHVDSCENQKERCYLLNTESVSRLIKICSDLKIHLIHISTDFVFDGLNGPYSETDRTNPLNLYGESKLQSEKLLQASGIEYTILRTMLVYGLVADMSRSNFVLWAKNNLEQGMQTNAVTDHWRMPTYVEDLANACLLAIAHKKTGIFHICGKTGGSIFELILEIADFWNLDKTLIQPILSSSLNAAAERPHKTGFILDKAMDQLKFQPKTFNEGLNAIDLRLKTIKNDGK